MERFLGRTAGSSVVDMDHRGDKEWVPARGQFGKQDPGKLRCWPDDRVTWKSSPHNGCKRNFVTE